MQTRTLFLLGLLVCLFAVVSAGGGFDKKEMMKKCYDDEINVDEVFKGIDDCKKEVKTEEERRRRRSPGGGGKGKGGKKNMCVAVCAWKKQGVLDDSGQFNEEGAKKHVEAVYPAKYQEDALTKIKECVTASSSKFSMEDKCKGYKDFKKCSLKAHMDTCGIEMPKGKGKKGKKDE